MSKPKYKLHQIIKIGDKLYIIRNREERCDRPCIFVCPFQKDCELRSYFNASLNNSCENLIGDSNHFEEFKGGI